MKRHTVLIIILIILGLFIAFSAAAHAYDSPLTSIEHKTDDIEIWRDEIYEKIQEARHE
jgi:hypothetical protein